MGMFSLSEMHIDHRSALNGAPTALRSATDQIENLQVICRRCNQAKGTMNAAAFERLMTFLRGDPELYDHVLRRLAQGSLVWALRRRTAS